MRYEKTIKVRKEDVETINKFLYEQPKCESDCLGEDETISYTASFDNGIEIDIKCCGVQYEEGEDNTAWTEAVLFDNNSEVCCSEPDCDFLGEWEFEYDDDEYVVIVESE